MRDRHETQRHVDADSPDAYPPGVAELLDTVRNWTRRTGVATNWRADTIILPAGMVRTVAHENKQRSRLVIWADGNNGAPTWLSAAPINQDPTGADRSGALKLPVSGAAVPVQFDHCGAVYAFSIAAVTIYAIQEYLA